MVRGASKTFAPLTSPVFIGNNSFAKSFWQNEPNYTEAARTLRLPGGMDGVRAEGGVAR